MFDVAVIGAGPSGVLAALRAADLGARTALITRGEFGGMAANDGPIPVRALAHAARLMREARRLGQYGVSVSEPTLDYPRLVARVREVVEDVRRHSAFRAQLESLSVTIHERAGVVRFTDSHTVQAASGLRLQARKFILCTGAVSRQLQVPGSELTVPHSAAWSLTSVPPSLLVIGAGDTGVQVASIFNAFGARVQLFEKAPRIIPTDDEDVSAAMAAAFRAAGIVVHEDFGTIERFEQTPGGVRMVYSKDGERKSAEAAVAVASVGWVASNSELNLPTVGVETDTRGFVRVDGYLRTTAPHVLAAGDITGHLMLVPQASLAGFVAATNAVRGDTTLREEVMAPIGSFTDPEYAQVGHTEARARAASDVVVSVVRFDSVTRPIIDGRTTGFCKLIVDRATARILGCHVVGERAVEIVQVAAIAMAAGMKVDVPARIPLSFPTYTGIFSRAAANAARQLNLTTRWEPPLVEGEPL